MSLGNKILNLFGRKKTVQLFEAQGMSAEEAEKMATVLAKEEYLLEDGRAVEYDMDSKKAVVMEANGLKSACPAGTIKLGDGTTIDVVAHTAEEIAALTGAVEVEVSTPTGDEPVLMAEETKPETPAEPTETAAAEETKMNDIETVDGKILSFTDTGNPVLIDGVTAMEGKYEAKNGQLFIVDANGLLTEMTPLAADLSTQTTTEMEAKETAEFQALKEKYAALEKREKELVETNKRLAAEPHKFAALDDDKKDKDATPKTTSRFGNPILDNLTKGGK